MKKKERPRLTLSRETIHVLNDPALLEQARGGALDLVGTATTRGDTCPSTSIITAVNG
jgi:hypothetical protein